MAGWWPDGQIACGHLAHELWAVIGGRIVERIVGQCLESAAQEPEAHRLRMPSQRWCAAEAGSCPAPACP